MSKKSTKRAWRKLLKKQQRKRKRQKLAKERDKRLEEEELIKLEDPSYRELLLQQERSQNLKILAEEKQREENEELWLRSELLAQTQFRMEEQKRLAKEKVQEELRLKEEQRLKEQKEVLRRKREQAEKEFEESMQHLQNYLDDTRVATPQKFQKFLETRPGEKLCEFYSKTNCCRFGLGCVYNHRMPLLSKVLLIKHFFQHPLLDGRRQLEYSSADEHLEISERDFQDDYREFCADVWPELESFGVLVNFRTVKNKLPHTRGHVFVEYSDKRSALKAFINLQNRYYACKRLKVEFSHITHWRSAVCGMIRSNFLKGMSLARKCPKGDNCNYLHLMVNPDNKYNSLLEPLERARTSNRSLAETSISPALSWNDVLKSDVAVKTTRWRWSESPEIELKSTTTANLISNGGEQQNLNRTRVKNSASSEHTSSEINDQSSSETHKTDSRNLDYGQKRKHKSDKGSPSKQRRNDKHKHHKRSHSKEKSQHKRSSSKGKDRRYNRRNVSVKEKSKEKRGKSEEKHRSPCEQKHKKSKRSHSISKNRPKSPSYRRNDSREHSPKGL